MATWVESNFRILCGLAFPLYFIVGAVVIERGFWRSFCRNASVIMILVASTVFVLARAWEGFLWVLFSLVSWRVLRGKNRGTW